jgi:protein disulfide-isomerase A6
MSNTKLLTIFIIASIAILSSAQVIELTSKNWEVVDKSDLFMIAFTAPWCGHCKSLKPEYYKAAESLGGVVNMGNVNCDDEKELAGKFGVQGFPTIKIFSKGKVVDDYQRGRDASSIVTDLMSRFNKLPDNVKIFKSKAEIDAFAKPLALLFTTKKSVPAMFKSLSLDLKNVGFGVVYDEEVMKEFEITSPPKIIVLNGEETLKYEGDLKRPKIYEFLKKFNEKEKPTPVHVEKPVKPFEIDALTEKNMALWCDNMCVIGCAANRDELTPIGKKYSKEKLKFFWIDSENAASFGASSFCKRFSNAGTNLVVFRAKKMKIATLPAATLDNSERFFENILYGGAKFETLEENPATKNDHQEL